LHSPAQARTTEVIVVVVSLALSLATGRNSDRALSPLCVVGSVNGHIKLITDTICKL
jgi:hypothetical protein